VAPYGCSIYAMRPAVCRLFGHVDGLTCPVVGELVQIILKMTADKMMKAEDTDVIMDSTSWKW
jgi:Fe-S-cluster containining protein